MTDSLPELLQRRIALTPEGAAYRHFDALAGRWTSHSWRETGVEVARYGRALQGEALEAGERIGILLPNGFEHVCLDQAALAAGLVPVPLHVIDNPENIAYVLADCGAALLAVDSLARWQALEPLRERLPALRRVVYLGAAAPAAGTGDRLAVSLASWLARGAPSPAGPVQRSIAPEALAAIVYTSGTTGRPKGVMLTHRNVLANVNAILERMPVGPQDVFLSFLPLSHTLERTVGYYLPIAAGACVAYARSTALLMEDLRRERPTVLISVPRIYERVYARIREELAARPLRRVVFDLAVYFGWRRFVRRPQAAQASAVTYSPLDASVGRSIRGIFGGRLRAAVAGGAPLTPAIARPFLALGIPLLQGYGMTEAAPVISCNVPDDNEPQSVGRPLPGVEVRIGADRELLVRGANVMRGYWQRAQDTASALDPAGWLHTGDQAELVDGRIYIRGRIKDILVTSTGEKIAAVDVENAILADPSFEQALVIGEGRPYLAALLVPASQAWLRECARLGLDAADPASLGSAAAQAWALERVAGAVRSLPAYARPRRVALLRDPWTVESALLTPTLKPKRRAIEARFATEIAALYAGHAGADHGGAP